MSDKDPADQQHRGAREPRDTDFFIQLDGVGSFRFGRRTYGDRIRIKAECLRMMRELGELNPDEVDVTLQADVGMVAAYKVLMVDCPEGWQNPEAVDVVAQPGFSDDFMRLYVELGEQEERFRTRAKARSEGQSEGAGKDSGVLVSAEVQPQPA